MKMKPYSLTLTFNIIKFSVVQFIKTNNCCILWNSLWSAGFAVIFDVSLKNFTHSFIHGSKIRNFPGRSGVGSVSHRRSILLKIDIVYKAGLMRLGRADLIRLSYTRDTCCLFRGLIQTIPRDIVLWRMRG